MNQKKVFYSLINIFFINRVYKYLPLKMALFYFIYIPYSIAENNEIRNSSHQGDTILFSGYEWAVKESLRKQTGPGNNYFSGSKENIYVDSDGKLHLRITHKDDKWFCPEVKITKSLGTGRYYFYLYPLAQPLDKDVVIGLFLYDREDTSNFHKEVDIEISQWGLDTMVNSQYVIQPKESDAYKFQTDFSIGTKHLIEVKKKKISFKSFYGTPDSSDIPLEYSSHSFNPEYSYSTITDRISMNVWLYHTSEPSNLKEFEVIISHFEFEPFWFDKFLKIFKKKNHTKK